MSTSSRPTGTTRGLDGTMSTTVRRPCGSLAVVTCPTGLCRRMIESFWAPISRPSNCDAVGLLDERVELAGLAVDEHAAGLDQVVGLAAGGDAGSREIRVQSHG